MHIIKKLKYGSIEQIERAIANNAENVMNAEIHKTHREMVLAERDAYKERELEKIMQSQPFGDRLTISKAGKLFVKNVQKDEWPAYNKIKDKLEEIKKEEDKYIEASWAYEPKERAYSDREIEEMKQDLERLKSQKPKIDTTKEREEYEKISKEVEKYEKLYKEQLFEERTGHKLSELNAIPRTETSDKVRIDEKGHFTNVYAKSDGEVYKVLAAKVEENYSYLEVETLNGDKQRLSMTTSWNWRMRSERDAYNSLPNVYTVEDDKGNLTKEPVDFPKFVWDSSD